MRCLTATQKTLIRSVAQAEKEELPTFYKCARILAVAAEELKILTPEIERRLFLELDENDERIEELYLELVGLVDDGTYLDGQGNFGCESENEPPANPLFTECWLTDKGRELVAVLSI